MSSNANAAVVRVEFAALPSCLDALLTQTDCPPMQVVVAVNGSNDGTATRAKSYEQRFEQLGHVLSVVEIDEANKPAALNAGDAAVTTSNAPRVYLDADIVLTPDAIAQLTEILTAPDNVHISSPVCSIPVPDSFVTRAYRAVWLRLPYFDDGVIGCGVYAVSAAGRKRWDEFPPIIADDKFARLMFDPAERAVTPTAEFRFLLPEGFLELVRVRSRWSAGNRELRHKFPAIVARDIPRLRNSVRRLATHPALWFNAVWFVAVYVSAELLAFRRWRRGITHWERSYSTRTPLPAAAEIPQD